MANIDDIEIPSLLLAEQGSNPSTPASGYGRLFVKSDGVYFIDDAGSVTGPLGGGGGGGGGLTLLDTWEHSVDGDTTNMDFSSLAQSHTDLLIRGWLRCNAAGNTSVVNLQVGSTTVDSGSNYYYDYNQSGTDAAGSAQTDLELGRVAADSGATAGVVHPFELTIYGYADADFPRYVRWTGVNRDANGYILGAGWWNNAASTIDIVRLTGEGNFVDGKVQVFGR